MNRRSWWRLKPDFLSTFWRGRFVGYFEDRAEESRRVSPRNRAGVVYRDYALALEQNGRASEASRMASLAARRYEAPVQHDAVNFQARDSLAKLRELLH
jgi:hypothetical protein